MQAKGKKNHLLRAFSACNTLLLCQNIRQMIGAIIGDIVGSRFEWDNNKSKKFTFLHESCFPTDDSFMTLAIGAAILRSKPDFTDLSEQAVYWMQEIGRAYPDGCYGGRFAGWLLEDNPQPYNSFGNGSAMRVSAVGYVGDSEDEVKKLSHAVTAVTHNHPEGLKGAEATAMAIYLARTGSKKEDIRRYIRRNYYDLNFTLDDIWEDYLFNETCQETVPQALQSFFESNDFEDAVRNAISIGGDSDTLAAITGSVAAAYYGVPNEIRNKALTYLDKFHLTILREFEKRYPDAAK